MPELAEVALYARDLSNVTNRVRLSSVHFPNRRDWGNRVVPPSVCELFRSLVGSRVDFSSAGKALHLHRKDKAPLIEFRLGMTGQFHLQRRNGKWTRHYFLILNFGTFEIAYADPRRFGRIKIALGSPPALGGFRRQDGFTKNRSYILPDGFLTKPRISWLLDGGEESGIGNYMANEALGRLGLSPFRPCKNPREARTILRECWKIATESYEAGGNSFSSGFHDLSENEGRYINNCSFYGNENVPRYLFRGRPVYTRHKPL